MSGIDTTGTSGRTRSRGEELQLPSLIFTEKDSAMLLRNRVAMEIVEAYLDNPGDAPFLAELGSVYRWLDKIAEADG